MIFFVIYCDFFKDLVKIKNKRKIEKPLAPHPQTGQGGYLNGFVSLRRLNGQFYGSERKRLKAGPAGPSDSVMDPNQFSPLKLIWVHRSCNRHAWPTKLHPIVFDGLVKLA